MPHAILKQHYETIRKNTALSKLVGAKWCSPKRNTCTFCARWCARGPCQSVVKRPQISVAALLSSSRLSSEPATVIPRRTRKKYLQQNPEHEYRHGVTMSTKNSFASA